MADASLELQGMIVSTLRANTAVMALVSGVYDQPPSDASGAPLDTVWGAANGYISLGPEDILTDDADCVTGATHTVQIDVWSRKVGRVHCKQICAAVKAVLHDQDLQLSDNALVQMTLEVFHVLRDPDGLTTHGAMQFTAIVEEPD